MMYPKVGDLYAERFEITSEGALCEAVDRERGAGVLVRPSSGATRWPEDVDAITVARHLQREPIEGTRPVVWVDECVVFADTPAPKCDGAMPLVDAAQCALRACEIAAELFSLGFDALSFNEKSLAAGYLDGRPAVLFTVPAPYQRRAMPCRDRFFPNLRSSEEWEGETLLAALVCCLFFALAPAAYSRAIDPTKTGFGAAALLARLNLRREEKAPVNPHLALLSRGCGEQTEQRPEERAPGRIAEVARALAELVDTPDARARAAAIKRIPKRALRYDWDAIAAWGDRLLARGGQGAGEYVTPALGEAHHQRACAAWERGDFELALRAVNRAIDVERIAPYLVTRALVLIALGRVGEARYAVDAAHELIAAYGHDAAEPSRFGWTTPYVPDDAMRGRAFATRARVTLAEGDVAGALRDYAEAVRRVPSNARYRWSLALVLRKLGRDDDAQKQAREALRLDPSDASRARYERHFAR